MKKQSKIDTLYSTLKEVAKNKKQINGEESLIDVTFSVEQIGKIECDGETKEFINFDEAINILKKL